MGHGFRREADLSPEERERGEVWQRGRDEPRPDQRQTKRRDPRTLVAAQLRFGASSKTAREGSGSSGGIEGE